MRLKNLTK